MLKRGAANVQGEIKVFARIVDESDHLDHESLEARGALDQTGTRELLLEFAVQGFGVVAEQDGADALRACGDEDGAERALADGECDVRIGCASTECVRCHAESLRAWVPREDRTPVHAVNPWR
jgi:hypothetical protein